MSNKLIILLIFVFNHFQSLLYSQQIITPIDNDEELFLYLKEIGEVKTNDVLIFDELLFSNFDIEIHRFGQDGFHVADFLYCKIGNEKIFIDEYSFECIYEFFNEQDFFLILEEEKKLLVLGRIIEYLLGKQKFNSSMLED